MPIIHPQDIQKHSVHTLIFRSLKRTHDMFLSEEGALPPLDLKAYVSYISRWTWNSEYILKTFLCSEAVWKASKARDTYGPIVSLVKKQQEHARKTGIPINTTNEALAIHNKSGIPQCIYLKIYIVIRYSLSADFFLSNLLNCIFFDQLMNPVSNSLNKELQFPEDLCCTTLKCNSFYTPIYFTIRYQSWPKSIISSYACCPCFKQFPSTSVIKFHHSWNSRLWWR